MEQTSFTIGQIIIAILGSSGVTTVIGYLFRRAFYRKEVEEKNSDIILKNMTIYQNMLDDIALRYELKIEERDEEIQLLRIKVNKQAEENKALQEEVAALKKAFANFKKNRK